MTTIEDERRRIGTIAAEAFILAFLRRQRLGGGPGTAEEDGKLRAYRHVIRLCGLAPPDDADGDMPTDIYARELLERPEMATARSWRDVREWLAAVYHPTAWMHESL